MYTILPLFIGSTELLLIVALALLLFGGKKLPEMMRGLGRGVKEFKDGLNGLDDKDALSTSNDKDAADKKAGDAE